MKNTNSSRRINILRDSVALQIAAGEVIDRPFSVIRELLDNAIDSGASHIDVYIEEGGLKHIRVLDNGTGMSSEDIKICYLTHSTSKIREVEDLDSLLSLGFRGEALASIAACSRLEIISSENDEESYRLIVHDSKFIDFSPFKGKKGTMVDVSYLFHSLPARKKFLKRPASEAAACRKIFIEKTLPFYSLNFRFYQDRDLKLFFPASSLKERILSAYPGILHKDLIHEIEVKEVSFSLKIIAGDPSLSRKDRRYIQIFLNNRKITDFSLSQAVEYGFSEFLPGGSYPVAFVFISIDPALIDFNIHPAKKEVRIKNTAELHHGIVTAVKNLLSSHTYNFKKSFDPGTGTDAGDFTEFPGVKYSKKSFENRIDVSAGSFLKKDMLISERPTSYLAPVENTEHTSPPFQYMGQIFDLFLIAVIGENVYFIDQHASHEKILFNEFMENPQGTQKLLVPLIFNVEAEVEELIKENVTAYREMGILLENISDGQWAVKGLPEKCIGQENLIIDFIKTQKGAVKDLKISLYADMACKSAIKDGEHLDSVTAIELINETMRLDNARCPHGRPLWFQISRNELFKLVGRT